MKSSSTRHDKGVANLQEPAYSSPLAAKHSAETQVAVVVLGGGEAGLERVCGRLGGWRLAGDSVVVGSALVDKNSSTSC
jgi:putative N-acetylmannosamine-6-phosphate epimerase